MVDHTIEVKMNISPTMDCTDVNPIRDRIIIEKMALALMPKEAPYFPMALMEAERIYRLVCAMRLALEEECATGESITQVD